MTSSLATAINVVLDGGIVVAIVSLLGWGIRDQRRHERRLTFVERRRGVDRRRRVTPFPAQAERRASDRRVGRPIPSV